jgi:hypothetical protein
VPLKVTSRSVNSFPISLVVNISILLPSTVEIKHLPSYFLTKSENIFVVEKIMVLSPNDCFEY